MHFGLRLVSFEASIVPSFAAIGSLLVVGLTVISGAIKIRNDWSNRNTWNFESVGGRSGMAYLALAIGVISVISFSGYLIASCAAIVLGEEALTETRARKLDGMTQAANGAIAGAMGIGMVVSPIVYHLLAYVARVGTFHGRDYEIRSDLLIAVAVVPLALVTFGATWLLVTQGRRPPITDVKSNWAHWRRGRRRLMTSQREPHLVLARFLYGLGLGQVPAAIFIAVFTHLNVSVNPIPFGGGP